MIQMESEFEEHAPRLTVPEVCEETMSSLKALFFSDGKTQKMSLFEVIYNGIL